MIILERKLSGVTGKTLARFVARARRAAGLDGKVNVLVTSSGRIRELNRRFRRKDHPTDVLSFPALPELKDGLAGDIVISGDLARENAQRFGHATAVELKVLILHGALHLAGFDHERDSGQMARREERLRASLGLPAGLIERTEKGAAVGTPPRRRRKKL